MRPSRHRPRCHQLVGAWRRRCIPQEPHSRLPQCLSCPDAGSNLLTADRNSKRRRSNRQRRRSRHRDRRQLAWAEAPPRPRSLTRTRGSLSLSLSLSHTHTHIPRRLAALTLATDLSVGAVGLELSRWPCDVTAASPGPDGLASLLIGFGCLCALTGRVGVAQYQPERGSLRGVEERVHPPLDVLAFLSEFLGPNVELGDAGAGLADLGQELVQPGRVVGVDPRRFIVGRWLFHSGMTVSPRTRIVPDPSGSIAVRRGRGGRGATDIKLRERLKGDVSRAPKSLVGGQARWKRLSPAGNPGKRRSV